MHRKLLRVRSKCGNGLAARDNFERHRQPPLKETILQIQSTYFDHDNVGPNIKIELDWVNLYCSDECSHSGNYTENEKKILSQDDPLKLYFKII